MELKESKRQEEGQISPKHCQYSNWLTFEEWMENRLSLHQRTERKKEIKRERETERERERVQLHERKRKSTHAFVWQGGEESRIFRDDSSIPVAICSIVMSITCHRCTLGSKIHSTLSSRLFRELWWVTLTPVLLCSPCFETSGRDCREQRLQEETCTGCSRYARLSVCLSLSLHACLSVSLSARLSVCLSLRTPVCLSLRTPVCLSLRTPVCLSLSPHDCLSVSLSARLSVCLSLRTPVCLSLSLSARLSVFQSARQSVSLSARQSVSLSARLSVSLSARLSVSLHSSTQSHNHCCALWLVGKIIIAMVIHICSYPKWYSLRYSRRSNV